jgi:hypothetical protein
MSLAAPEFRRARPDWSAPARRPARAARAQPRPFVDPRDHRADRDRVAFLDQLLGSVPATGDGTSTLTLSVSRLAIGSSAATASPGFFSHWRERRLR